MTSSILIKPLVLFHVVLVVLNLPRHNGILWILPLHNLLSVALQGSSNVRDRWLSSLRKLHLFLWLLRLDHLRLLLLSR
jgi:hypothetical protein